MLKQPKILLIVGLLAVGGLSAGFVQRNNDFEIAKSLELLANMLNELNAFYVDDIDNEKLIQKGIAEMLGALDPYTSFIPEEDLSNYKLQTTGKYGGIGALIRQEKEHVIIAEPYESFPAHQADLRAGDKLLSIGGKSVKGKTTGDVSKLLKGRPGTSIEITIERIGENKPVTKSITRQEIKINSVPYYGLLDNNVGYIRLSKFTENCSKAVTEAFIELKNKHNIQSLIFDLRGNPGGLLNEAIDVANIFVPKKEEIVSTRGRERHRDRSYYAQNKAIDTEIPIAVLISGGSASASEIVSGVIQDLDRGVVIGKRSFGKGLVQTTKNLGYNSKMKITTAKYYLPSGRCIQAINYSGQYKDGSEKIPDSLRTAYKTKNGRTVYDAGGIDPDVVIEPDEFANITISLLQKQLIFEYANLYRSKNESIPEPSKFELTDKDFEDFVQFLQGKDYEYTTESEKLLKTLKETAETEKYSEAIASEIKALENDIQHDKEKDLQKFKTEIKQMLEYEIVLRYHFQDGEIEETLEDDETVAEALKVLAQKNQYKKLLSK